jgi:coniferyl-aldehyde dehydrogenase
MQAELQTAFDRQRKAYASQGGLSLAQRRAELKRLRALVKDNAEAFALAVSQDFGGRSRHETLVAEIGVILAAVDHALPRLARWSKSEHVRLGWRYWPARGEVRKQPLGAVGVLAPWNYPVQLALMPVVGALAAGCRIILKPSELTPATSRLMADLAGAAFSPDVLTVITGGPDVAAALSRLPFDKLVFTGSGRVGREVLHAAADHHTPVLLELGGKSPAVVDRSADLDEAATAIMAGKLLNAGQTCVAPDYVLIHRDRRDDFVDACRRAATRLYPDPSSPDYSAINGEAARERLLRLCAGHRSEPLFGVDLPAPKLSPTLLMDPPPDSAVMREEIFGPVLPVLTFDSPEDAVARINSLPDALALYWFGRDPSALEAVIAQTRSGSVAVNETVLQAAVEALPFGGVGASGYGAYHGRAGFDAFTHRRAVFKQSRHSGTRYMRPPYGPMAERLFKFLLR